MYTIGMTADELVKEFNADLPQVIRISDIKQKKVDKRIRQASVFPVYLYTAFKSLRGNQWIILFEAKSRKAVGDNCLMTMVSLVETNEGRYAIMWSSVNEKPQYLMFTPHFFQRFASRAGIDASGVELVYRYFKFNSSYGFNVVKEIIEDKQKINVYGSTSEGVALGVKLYSENNIILFKTFITYDMCKGNQIEDFARADSIRRELHDETY